MRLNLNTQLSQMMTERVILLNRQAQAQAYAANMAQIPNPN